MCAALSMRQTGCMPRGHLAPWITRTPTMKYQILQLADDGPRFRELAFRPLAEGQRVDMADYRQVYAGEIETGDHPAAVLEVLFRKFNIDQPADYRARSMSMSDMVLLGGCVAFYCQMVGWEPVMLDRIDGDLP
jgi:YodL-like protein